MATYPTLPIERERDQKQQPYAPQDGADSKEQPITARGIGHDWFGRRRRGCGTSYLAFGHHEQPLLFRASNLKVLSEGSLEIVDVVEIFATVFLRFAHQADIDQIVDDRTKIAGAMNAPVIQHGLGH